MNFEIIKHKECNLRCSISSQEMAIYEVFFYYEANGRRVLLGRFCEKHFQEFLKKVQTLKVQVKFTDN